MSGPESRHEPDDPRVGDRPLSPEVHAGHAHTHARAGRGPEGEEAGDDADEGHRPRKGRKGRGFKIPSIAPALGLIASFPRRRRERPAPEPPAEGEAEAEGEREGKPPRTSPLAMKPETQVGLAAVVSFVLILGVLVVQKGWLGKIKAPLATVSRPSDKAKDKKTAAPAIAAVSKVGGGRKPGAPAVPPIPSDVSLAPVNDPAEPRLPPSNNPDRLREPLLIAQNDPRPGDPKAPPAGGAEEKPAPAGLPDKPLELPAAGDPIGLPTMPAHDPATPPAPQPAPAEPANAKPADLPAPVSNPEPPPTTGVLPMPDMTSGAPPTPTAPGPSPAPEPPSAPASQPSILPPTMEKPPLTASEPTPAPSAAGLGPGWVVVKSGGKKSLGSDAAAGPAPVAPAAGRDAPPARDDDAIVDQVEPVLHTVQPGENFWTISKLYYHSGRYYQALHAANRKQVPEIGTLWVGTVLRIPPPESLDRALIQPPGRPATTDGPAVSRASRRSETPAEEVIQSRPVRPTIPRDDADEPEPPRRPTYRVKANETLRSIARDALGDSKRYPEILALNREAIDDPRAPLAAGMTLTLPEDAVIGRRGR